MGLLNDAPLNKLPQGLLDFFGIKSFGRYPQFLEQRVQPMIDLWQQYAETNCLIVSGGGIIDTSVSAIAIEITSTTPVNLSNGTSITVPNDEAWYIPRMSIGYSFGLLAGQSARFGVRLTNENQVVWPAMLTTGYDTSDAAIVRAGQVSLIDPIFLRPGTRVSVGLHGTIGGTVAQPVGFTLGFWVNRMRV